MSQNQSLRVVVLFDGVCGLCDRTVRFFLKRDSEGVFRFAPLQGATAAAVMERHPEIPIDLQTIVCVRDFGTTEEVVHVRSDAVLDMLDILGGFWKALAWSRIVPRFMRDAVYQCVARNRYRWFGKYDTCRMPQENERGRFLL